MTYIMQPRTLPAFTNRETGAVSYTPNVCLLNSRPTASMAAPFV